MKRIMFICHGNICRSPMAEFIMKKLVRDRGLSDEFYIASSATSAEEIYSGTGSPVYPPARRTLIKHGIPCEQRRATLLCRADYEKYDLLVVMDERNVKSALRIFGSDPEGKIVKLKDFGTGGDVLDPWYTGDFDSAYEDIYAGCLSLFERLVKEIY